MLINYDDNLHDLLHISQIINNWSNRYLLPDPNGSGPMNTRHLVHLIVTWTGPRYNGLSDLGSVLTTAVRASDSMTASS